MLKLVWCFHSLYLNYLYIHVILIRLLSCAAKIRELTHLKNNLEWIWNFPLESCLSFPPLTALPFWWPKNVRIVGNNIASPCVIDSDQLFLIKHWNISISDQVQLLLERVFLSKMLTKEKYWDTIFKIYIK